MKPDNTIPIANIYNYFCDKKHEGKMIDIYLKPYELKCQDFISLFYSSASKKFCINKNHRKNNAILLSKQVFLKNNTGFSANTLLECGDLVEDLNPESLFGLQKELKEVDSLFSIHGTCRSLSLKQILAQQEETNSSKLFQVKLTFWSKILEKKFNIYFQYQVFTNELLDYLENESRGLVEAKNKFIKSREIELSQEIDESLFLYDDLIHKTTTPNFVEIPSKKTDKIETKKTVVSSIQKNIDAIRNRPYNILSQKQKKHTGPTVVKRKNVQLDNVASSVNIIDELTKLNKRELPMNNFVEKTTRKPLLLMDTKVERETYNYTVPQLNTQPQPKPQTKPQPQQKPQSKPQTKPKPQPKPQPTIYETILNSIDKNDNITEYDDYTEYNEYDDYE